MAICATYGRNTLVTRRRNRNSLERPVGISGYDRDRDRH
jgi:hypothetical protein